MIGLDPAMDVDYSGDDSDGSEPEGNSVLEKFRALSDMQLDDEIEKYKGYATGSKTGLKLPDDGAKFALYLQDLEKEKEARRIKRSLVASTAEPQDIDLHCRGPGTSEDFQREYGTWSTSQLERSGDFATCSTVKTESLSTKILLHSPTGFAPHKDVDSVSLNNGNIIVSTEIISQSPSPERGASPVETTTGVSPGKLAESSSRELLTPDQFDQSEGCIVCKKTSQLSNVPGKNGLFCSVCRRKAKTPDPSVYVDCDLKTPAAKAVRRSARKRAREADIVGRTPDTAMEIDSSDEDEKVEASIGSVLKRSSIEVPRRMGLRSTYRRRMEGYKVAFPSRSDPDAVEILPSDLQRLDPMEFLNDTVIDFYITYIQTDEFLGSEGRQRFHFFNSFFYKKLSEVVSAQKKKGRADFSKLRKWTKGRNVFEKDYLFVPIHDKLHWSLAIICFPGSDKGGSKERCIIHLDSMAHGHDSQRVFRLLRNYLVAEWKHSVEAGENQADECFHTVKSLKADNIPSKKVPFGRNWFLSTEASSLRTSIQEQLCRLFDQEILDQAEVNKQSISNGGTEGACEVAMPVDGEATCK